MAFNDAFRAIAAKVSCGLGSPWALAVAFSLVVIWAASGPFFGYSDAWQLVINTSTTVVTFLMAFLIQSTQFRESKAVNLKIDELLRAVEGARTSFVNLESLSDAELEAIERELHRLGRRGDDRLSAGGNGKSRERSQADDMASAA